MNQKTTGTIKGNTIVLDAPLSFPDGQAVEVVVRDQPSQPRSGIANLHEHSPPAWWTDEDDRILNDIYQTRKRCPGS
jgi:hypothetical protein